MSHAAAKVARYTDASDFKVIPIIDTDTCRDLKAKIKTQFELSESFTVFICHRTPQSSNRQLLSDRALLGPIVSAFENPAANIVFDFADFVEILVRGPTGSPSMGSLVRLSSYTLTELVQQIEAEFPILKNKQSGYKITAARSEFDPKTSVVNDDRVMEFCVQGMQFFIESTPTPAFENPYARVASVALEEIGRDSFLRLLRCTLALCEPIDMESLSVFSESTMPQTIMFVEKMRSLLNVSNGTVSVLHESVKDFFLDSELCPSEFYVGSPKALSSLSKLCLATLSYLLEAVSTRDAVQLLGRGRVFGKKLPLTPVQVYATKHWSSHLNFGSPPTSDLIEFSQKYGPNLLAAAILSRNESLFVMVAQINPTAVQELLKLRIFNSPCIYEAAKAGLSLVCKTLLETGLVDVNCLGRSLQPHVGECSRTPVFAACREKSLKTVQVLVSYGADWTIRDGQGAAPFAVASNDIRLYFKELESIKKYNEQKATMIPLHLAISNKEVDKVKSLHTAPACLDRDPTDESTAFHWATRFYHPEIFSFLISSVDSEESIHLPDKSGQTPLHIASRYGHVEAAKVLITKGAAIDAQTNLKTSPLHYAATFGHVDIAQLLLENGALVNSRETGNQTPLHSSTGYKNLEMTRLLISKGANVDARDDNGQTPFQFAAGTGSIPMMELLLEHDASLDSMNNNNALPLYFCAMGGHVDAMKFLVERGAPINAVTKDNATAFYIAALNSRLDAMKYLMAKGADINAAGPGQNSPLLICALNGFVDGMLLILSDPTAVASCSGTNNLTPLHFSAQNGPLEAVQLLLEKGARLDALDGHLQTPLHFAVHTRDLEVVQFLISRGAAVNSTQPPDQISPLHEAASAGHLEMVELLLANGASVNTMYKVQPLHLAANYPKIVELLLKRGAIIPMAEDGRTACHFAAEKGNVESLKIFKNHGWSMTDDAIESKKTPLHSAAENGHADAIRYILENGGDLECRDSSKHTPFLLVARNGHVSAMQALLDAGADASASNNSRRCSLHLAAAGGHLEAVKWLVERGSPVDVWDDGRRSPLYLATEMECEESFQKTILIMAAGASYNPKKWIEVIEFLLENGASVTAMDPLSTSLNNSLLELANQSSKSEVIELFEKFALK